MNPLHEFLPQVPEILNPPVHIVLEVRPQKNFKNQSIVDFDE